MKLALNQGLSGAASLSGDLERVLEAERLAEWKTAGVTTLGVRGKIEAIRLMAELAL